MDKLKWGKQRGQAYFFEVFCYRWNKVLLTNYKEHEVNCYVPYVGILSLAFFWFVFAVFATQFIIRFNSDARSLLGDSILIE